MNVFILIGYQKSIFLSLLNWVLQPSNPSTHSHHFHTTKPSFQRTSTLHKSLTLAISPAGWYWIDPNLGLSTDAIKVWCNMSTPSVETCVHPVEETSSMPLQFLKKQRKAKFSQLKNGFKVCVDLSLSLFCYLISSFYRIEFSRKRLKFYKAILSNFDKSALSRLDKRAFLHWKQNSTPKTP